MFIPILFAVFVDLSVTRQAAAAADAVGLPDIKGLGRVFNESAILSNIDDRDTFCKGIANAIFPHPYAYNIYYRCRRNRRETWKCIGDLYFDREFQRCSPFGIVKGDAPRTIDLCHNQEDGLYPLYNSGCKQYVRCKEGVTIEKKECAENYLFSYSQQSCSISSRVSCVQPNCALDSDGFFVLPGSQCQAYYACRKGVRSDFLCPRGQIFNVETESCMDGGICYEQTCIGRMDGKYPDTTHGCDRYFTCRGGRLLEITNCPKFLKYDGKNCVSHADARCERPEDTAIAIYNRRNDECKLLKDGKYVIPGTDCTKIRHCSRGKTSGTEECPRGYRYSGNKCYHKDLVDCDDSCSEKPDGYYADESTGCHEYYLCFNGKIKERRKCENDTLFNGQICSPSFSVACSTKRSGDVQCEGLRNGFHADYMNGCHSYFYCHNQQIIVMNACPAGMRWNGSCCVVNREYRCDAPVPLSRCTGLATGLYQDFSSNCSNYTYCRDGEGLVLSCKDGEVYDGNRCRNSREYTCPNLIRDECFDRPDGYNQDEKSNCRSYFFCSKGGKIIYLCPGDLIFNGTHCVSQKEYTCPYQADDCNGKFDGYYPDEASSCRSYFYCLHEKRIANFNCGGEKIFDGEACTLTSDVKKACKKATDNLCNRRKDGKYAVREGATYIVCKSHALVQEQGFNSKSDNYSRKTEIEKRST